MATSSQVGSIFAREQAAARYFAMTRERRGDRDFQESRRQRILWVLCVIGVAAFVTGRMLAPAPGTESGDPVRAVVVGVCLLVAVLVAVAAGWTAVWVFREPVSKSTALDVDH